ncbi:MAG: trehalose-phosphatase [Gemmatimonadota bacterium]
MTLSRPPAVPPAQERWALFLDVDGTLVELAPRPDEVVVRDGLLPLLRDLRGRLDGALALVSGRGIDDLDRIVRPLRLPAVGLHGLERRHADGHREDPPLPAGWEEIRERLRRFATDEDGVLLEDKGAALALHYRQAPDAEARAHAEIEAAQAALGPPATVQPGKMVAELRAGPADKGDGIRALLDTEGFAGRTPVFLGDDLTDQAGFSAVNERDGLSIHVGSGDPGVAHHHLPDVTAVHAWLRHLSEALAARR